MWRRNFSRPSVSTAVCSSVFIKSSSISFSSSSSISRFFEDENEDDEEDE
jgi:hypothetical protein